jgi:hypothetical protein
MRVIDMSVQTTCSQPATQAVASLTSVISLLQEVRQIHRQSDHFGIFDTDIHATYFITFVLTSIGNSLCRTIDSQINTGSTSLTAIP